ncbi:hypothetical protein IT571_12705 [Candidatus Sumerlaeota bacterium]|nr:hypothetical protein [Candidatus Sumerlaeota bacterium]
MAACRVMMGMAAVVIAAVLLNGVRVAAATNLDEFFNLNAADFHQDNGPWPTLDQQLKMAKELGASDLRIAVRWDEVEPEKGRFAWEATDHVVDACTNDGISVAPVLFHPAKWANGMAPATESEWRGFAAFVGGVVTRYRDRIHCWDVWSQPNVASSWMPAPNAQHYGQLLAMTYDAIKIEDPKAQVVGMCLSGTDHKFMEAAYRAGARGKMDAVAYQHHATASDESLLEEEIRAMKRVMERYGDANKPLIVSEIGFPINGGADADAERQAEWIVKAHLVSIAEDAQRFYLSEAKPDALWGLYERDLAKGKSWHAYKAMTDRLKGAKYIGRVHRAVVEFARRDDAEFQMYEKDGELFGVAWVRKQGAPLRLLLASDQAVETESLLGEKQQSFAPNANGEVLVPISHEPVYLRHLKKDLQSLAAIRFDPPNVHLAPGETRTVTMIAENQGSAPLTIAMNGFTMPRKNFPVKFTWEPGDFIAEPGKTLTRTMTVTRSSAGGEFLPVNVIYNDHQRYSYRLGVYANPAFAINIRSVLEDANLKLRATYENLSSLPQGGRISWDFGGETPRMSADFPPLASTEEAVSEIPLSIISGEQRARFVINANDVQSSSRMIRAWGQPTRTELPAVDGNLEEWHTDSQAVLSPDNNQLKPDPTVAKLDAKDFSGTIWVIWSEDAMFFAAQVFDKTPLINNHTGADLWKGDSLEFFLGFDGPTDQEQYGRRNFQLGVSPGNGGKNPFVWNWNAQSQVGGAMIEGAAIATMSDATGYVIEGKIPLTSLGEKVEVGKIIGFDMHINNSDDEKADAPRAILGWNGTLNDFKDPSQWGIACILAEAEDGK